MSNLCKVPPGYKCLRYHGHTGPCAAFHIPHSEYTPEPDEVVEEIGWLVETVINGITMYMSCSEANQGFGWMTDVNEAIRFARREDALRVGSRIAPKAGGGNYTCVVVEHSWL